MREPPSMCTATTGRVAWCLRRHGVQRSGGTMSTAATVIGMSEVCSPDVLYRHAVPTCCTNGLCRCAVPMHCSDALYGHATRRCW